jgi:exonuclease SbcD
MIKILHTADIHLGGKFSFLGDRGKDYRNQLLSTFEKIVDLAIAEKVSLVLIAGDLFDTNRIYGITIDKVLAAFRKLEEKSVPVCILPGTHDVYDDNSIYRFLRFPPNVTVFTPDCAQKTYDALGLTVYGKAFDGKSYGDSPIKGLSLAEGPRYHIAMAHCSLKIPGMIERETMLLDVSEIANSGFDYLALGHWHSFQDYSQGNTRAFYCGSPEPISMDQKGAGNVAMVSILAKGALKSNLLVSVANNLKKCI